MSHCTREPQARELIHRLFESQAAHTPDAPAVFCEGETLTYGALNRRANQLARVLRGRGVGPDSLVGLCVHRSLEMVVALLGVLKAGGAYLPLDPDYPAERLAFMLEDAGVGLLLTQAALRPRLPASQACVLDLDDGAPFQGGEDGGDLPGGAGPDDLAYVIYTSGSTGRPKGVEIAHRGVCGNLRWRQETFPLSAQDRMLQTYSFSFDPSVWAFFWPLTAGAGLALPPPGRHGDPAYLCEAIVRLDVTVLGFSPSLLSVLLEQPGIAHCRSLRHVFCGGEALPPDLPRRFHALLAADLHNVYGPTEATIDAAWWTVPRGFAGTSVPIGRPLPDSEIYLLGEDGDRVPDGSPGELHVAGVGLARGYRGRPGLTAERFPPNPFDPERFPRLYRTGDLARRRADDALEYLGRLDQQVKVRGFRIEPGEIEAVLTALPDVREAVVLARQDGAGGQRLVAYVVPAGLAPSRRTLQDAVRASLPAHATPSAFVFLSALPLSPNGKLDRQALPPPAASDWEREGALSPARTPLQKALVEAFEALLDVRPLGIRDDFFEWGGHSLLAARLLNEIERRTGRRLPFAALSEGATVETLERLLGQSPELEESPLLRQWAGGSGRPLFFWHGSFTGGLFCGDLARALGPDRPFYAFSPHGLEGTAIPPTVEAMASECVAQLRRVQPSGPYRLGGFCNGGLVAYETARQLRARGESVEFLALIEMILTPTRVKLRLHHLACRLGRRLGLSAERQTRVSCALQAGVVPVLMAMKKGRGAWERGRSLLSRRAAPDWWALIPEAYRETAVHYQLGSYDGPLILVAARDSVTQARFPYEAGWQDLAPQTVLDVIPGGHYDGLGASLPDLAACLRRRLDGL